MIITDRQDELAGWLCSRAGGDHTKIKGQYIGNEINGKIVAVTGYTHFDGDTVRIHIAGDGKGGWFSREFCWFCFFYPFEQLGVKKLIGHVAGENKAALRFDKHLGFVVEQVVKGAAGGDDLHILTMTKDQCRFLKRKSQ